MRSLVPIAVLLFGCQPTEPLDQWCTDPTFAANPEIAPPCSERVPRGPATMLVGECGRFDMFMHLQLGVTFQTRSDGTLVAVGTGEATYGRSICQPWDCMTRDFLARINVNEAPPVCMDDVD